MTITPVLNRRHVLMGGAAVGGLAATGAPALAQDGALPDYVAWKEADALIVHSNNTMETRRDAFGAGPLTPEARLYVRNNVSPPPASILDDRDAWEVSIEGVAEPRALTVGELKRMGVETVAMVLQCSGNGRAFFEHAPSGTPWQVGAAGCLMWTGVPLRTVAAALGGPADGANYITATGGETIPEGVEASDVMVERSVPIAKLDDVLLAWEVNGAPISLAHGGPLRMITPGFTGVNSVKYVSRVALTAEQTSARIQQSRYRLQPVGEQGGPDWPSVWEMNVKSWITAPLEAAAAGPNVITGVAFGGEKAVASVEVSVDGGETWMEAPFVSPDLGRFAWRVFALPVDLPAGEHRLVSRATDADGAAQPEAFEPNQPGYNHNGWRAHGVTVAVS
jgi:sulfite oxidase